MTTMTVENARHGILFEQNSLWGLKDIDNNILFEPKYSFIGKCRDKVLFIEPNWKYMEMTEGCCTTGYMEESERPYIKDGKVGIEKDNKVLLPPIYDYLTKRFDDTYLVVKAGKEMYIDETGKEVLTRVRRFEGELLDSSPFWLRVNDASVCTFITHKGQSDVANPNVIKLNGEWVELERYSHKEVMEMLVNPEDDLSLSNNNLKLFNNDFSYEYSFYVVQAFGQNPLSQCLSQLKKMKVFCNSWYYVVKIWQAPGENVRAADLRNFEKSLRKTHMLGSPLIAIGHSNELNSGEVKMLFITYYNERCWPNFFEYEWDKMCNSLPITDLMNYIPGLKKDIEEHVYDKYQLEVYQDQLLGCIKNMKYYEGMTWNSTKPALEFFYNQGSPVFKSIVRFMKAAKNCIDNDPASELFLNAALWAIEKGDNVNEILSKHTSLDYLIEIMKINNSELAQVLYDCLLRAGAKTYKTLLVERATNKDYYKELEFLRAGRSFEKVMPSLSIIK